MPLRSDCDGILRLGRAAGLGSRVQGLASLERRRCRPAAETEQQQPGMRIVASLSGTVLTRLVQLISGPEPETLTATGEGAA